ncbi:MAG TPA: type II toxin-antitoxin system RelE/ParE family toxin [Chthoniobacteraceae bacterium]|jgi:plasmid stabilization system protein ParE|nr:type II toxin-antitoxin system RelE/ParE family toxin [Chthoniobacteraceae bacterium]
MIERVRFTPQARRDVREAREWYDAQRGDWGKIFVRRLEECTRAIQEMPRRFPIAGGEVRRAKMRQFPYDIIYEYSSAEVTIHAVFHRSRDQQRWMDRLS